MAMSSGMSTGAIGRGVTCRRSVTVREYRRPGIACSLSPKATAPGARVYEQHTRVESARGGSRPRTSSAGVLIATTTPPPPARRRAAPAASARWDTAPKRGPVTGPRPAWRGGEAADGLAPLHVAVAAVSVRNRDALRVNYHAVQTSTGVQLGATDPAASGNTAHSAPCRSPGAHAAKRAGNGRRA